MESLIRILDDQVIEGEHIMLKGQVIKCPYDLAVRLTDAGSAEWVAEGVATYVGKEAEEYLARRMAEVM